jgi:1-propanol dehydrogenase
MARFSLKTKVYSGVGSLRALEKIRDKTVWIVCDAFLANSDNLQLVLKHLDASNQIYTYSDIQPDPPIATVVAGIERLIKIKPQVVIGFGGGSAIDAAKAMVFFGQPIGVSIEQCIAIPTTSGTGSEVTSASVISDPDSKIKYPLFDERLYPDIAILEPRLTISVPPAVTANTGMDVLTHALESYVSNKADDYSDALAEKSTRLVSGYLVAAYLDGHNLLAREKLHNASNMAGIAFSHAGLGLNHAIAHQLGGQFHIPHGLANALLLPEVIRFNAVDANVRRKYAQMAELCGVIHAYSADEQAVAALIDHVKNLRRRMNMAETLQQLDISHYQVNKAMADMVKSARQDATFATNPIAADDRQIEQIIRSIM